MTKWREWTTSPLWKDGTTGKDVVTLFEVVSAAARKTLARQVEPSVAASIVRDHNAMPKMKNLEAVMKQLVAYFEVNERIRKQLPDVLWGRIQAALELDDDPPQAD